MNKKRFASSFLRFTSIIIIKLYMEDYISFLVISKECVCSESQKNMNIFPNLIHTFISEHFLKMLIAKNDNVTYKLSFLHWLTQKRKLLKKNERKN